MTIYSFCTSLLDVINIVVIFNAIFIKSNSCKYVARNVIIMKYKFLLFVKFSYAYPQICKLTMLKKFPFSAAISSVLDIVFNIELAILLIGLCRSASYLYSQYVLRCFLGHSRSYIYFCYAKLLISFCISLTSMFRWQYPVK